MTMDCKTNAYGNILIEYDANKSYPDIAYTQENHVIITYVPNDFMHQYLKYYLGRTKANGNIFGNLYAYHNFPTIENDMLQGECSIAFMKDDDSKENRAILVQVKKRPDNSLKNCAIREF